MRTNDPSVDRERKMGASQAINFHVLSPPIQFSRIQKGCEQALKEERNGRSSKTSEDPRLDGHYEAA